MDHDEIACPAVGFIEFVWIPDVKRKVEVALRIHLPGRHKIESFRDLAIALPKFGAGATGGSGDEITVEKKVRVAFFDPQLQLPFLLEGSNDDRGSPFELLFFKTFF